MKLLVTAFEPFGGENINPSAISLEHLGSNVQDNVVTLLLPVSFEKAPKLVCDAIDRYCPDIVVMLGQAGGRRAVTVEHVAINYADASIPDNDGARPCGEALVEGAPTAYFTTLPDKELIAYLSDKGVPCAQSLSAGAYVCNAVFYNALHHIAQSGKRISAGFIHVPYCAEQLEGKPEGTFALEQEKINLCVKTVAEYLLLGQR